jgi:hypothetical protein
MTLFLSTVTLAQTNQQPKPERTSQEKSITQRQISELPVTKGDYRPKLPLQSALKLAEGYIKKEKIDISPYYLQEAKFIMYGSKSSQHPCWSFRWVNGNGALGDYVEIIVSIETGTVRQIPSM